MKLMKYLVISILVVLAYSCAEPMLLNPDETPRGIFVTYDAISWNINSEDIEGTPVTGTFDAPANNVASHDVYVKRIYDDGASESDYVYLESITEFPYDFSVNGNELAALFGVPIEETYANFYTFNCEATGENGQVATFENLEGELISYPTQMQGFRFQAAVVCPSDPDVIVGTYTAVTSSTFPDFADPVVDLVKTITITTTDEEGFYSISDFTFGTYDHFYAAVGWCPYGDWEGTIQDVCGKFFLTNTFDPWGEEGFGDFTFNADGTIIVEGGTDYGEVWTAVLTKQ
jgi:hypothetical protein